jgi:hypothetical protein
MTRSGYNYLKVPDVAAEMEHAEKANLGGGLFFQNDIAFARDFKAARPGRQVVVRNYPDKRLPSSVDDWLKANQPLAEGGLIVQTVNEIGFGPDVIAFHETLLERIKRDRIRMNIGILGLSVGVPGADEWFRAERLIRLAADLRDQVHFILHEYWGGVITSGFIGGNPGQFINPMTWPTDTSEITMWHVGRYRFLKKFCRSKGLPLPRIVIGEFGADYVGDIGTWLKTLPSDGGKYDSVDGWRDLITQWRQWWPSWDGATAYMKQAEYADKHIYTDEEVELIAFYARWNDGSWGTYQTNPELDQQMENRGQAELNNPPAPPPVNEPPVIINPPPQEETPEPMPEETPTTPDETTPQSPPNLEWRKALSDGERARIEMGRLLAVYGNELRSFIVDDEAYKLIDKLAGLLDTKG